MEITIKVMVTHYPATAASTAHSQLPEQWYVSDNGGDFEDMVFLSADEAENEADDRRAVYMTNDGVKNVEIVERTLYPRTGSV